MKFVFFSMRNFVREGGGTIRMYGVLNALAEAGNDVIFISNAKKLEKFNAKIKHINIGYEVSTKKKSIFQGLLAFLPSILVGFFYYKMLRKIKKSLKGKENENIYFFQYLDNSVGYLLKRRRVIKNYINDIHGVVPLEFQYQVDTAVNKKTKLLYKAKYILSEVLDKKVFTKAYGFLFASSSMKQHFEDKYEFIKHKKAYILPNALNNESVLKTVDVKLKQKLINKYNLQNNFIVFFAGGYKATAGVEDLIQAFYKFNKENSKIKMILIGQGVTKKYCIELSNDLDLSKKIIFIDKIPYEDLLTYQNLANVIVCPDRQNLYSELIVHLKYFDALNSGRIVINGGFKSVKEINNEDSLSMSFKPSDVESLYFSLKNCKENYYELNMKYEKSKKFAQENLTYKKLIDVLYK